MFYAYVLENSSKNWYIGSSKDLKKRVTEHNQGKTYTTKKLKGPWILIYYEACLNEFDARRREKYLKSGRGRAYLKKRLHHYIQ